MQLPDLLARAETDHGGAAGERLVGYKVGCTSAKVQQAFGIPGPIYGRLWEGEQFQAPPEVSPMCLSLSSFNGLAIEGELMVQLVDTSGDSPAQWSAQAPCVFVCLCLSFSVSLFRDWLLVRAYRVVNPQDRRLLSHHRAAPLRLRLRLCSARRRVHRKERHSRWGGARARPTGRAYALPVRTLFFHFSPPPATFFLFSLCLFCHLHRAIG